MNITRALQIPGMMSEEELTYLAELASDREWIVEIGSWMGRSARAMADNTKGTVYCVDTWADDAYGPAPAETTWPKLALECVHREHGRQINDTVGPFRGNVV